MTIPANPFSKGQRPSASVLNDMAAVANSITNVAGFNGIHANLYNGQLQISGIKNKPNVLVNNLFANLFNTGDEDIEFGEIVSIEGCMHNTLTHNLDNPNNLKGSTTDFATATKNHKAGQWVIATERIPSGGVGKVCTSGVCVAKIWETDAGGAYNLFEEYGWKYVSEKNNSHYLQLRPEKNCGEVLWYDYDNYNETTETTFGLVKFPVVPFEDLKVVQYKSADELSFTEAPFVLKVDTDNNTSHAEVIVTDIDCPLNVITIDTPVAQNDYIVVNKKVLVGTAYDFSNTNGFEIGQSVNIGISFDDTFPTALYRGFSGYRVTKIEENTIKYGFQDLSVIYFEVDHMPMLGIALEDAGDTTSGEVKIAPCDYTGSIVSIDSSDTFYMTKVIDTEEGS